MSDLAPTPNPRRHWFQCNLRNLFSLFVLFGIALGLMKFVGDMIRTVEADAARARILESGRVVETDRHWLGDEADALKVEHDRKQARPSGSQNRTQPIPRP